MRGDAALSHLSPTHDLAMGSNPCYEDEFRAGTLLVLYSNAMGPRRVEYPMSRSTRQELNNEVTLTFA